MKFGKTFEKALEEEDIPDEWKAAAIKYKSLKVRRAPELRWQELTETIEMYQ